MPIAVLKISVGVFINEGGRASASFIFSLLSFHVIEVGEANASITLQIYHKSPADARVFKNSPCIAHSTISRSLRAYP